MLEKNLQGNFILHTLLSFRFYKRELFAWDNQQVFVQNIDVFFV